MGINIYGGSYRPKLQRCGETTYIYDDFRAQWVVLQPEEGVRQWWLHYVVEECGYPKLRMGVEQKVEVNHQAQRADVVVYDRQGGVYLLVECKAPSVRLSKKVLAQAVRYSVSVGAQYMAITNGGEHYIFCRDADCTRQQAEYPPAPR